MSKRLTKYNNVYQSVEVQMKATLQYVASWTWIFWGHFSSLKGLTLFINSDPLSPLSSLSMLLAKAYSGSSSPSTMSSRRRTWSAPLYSGMFCSSVVDVGSVCVPISCTMVVGIAASVSLLACGCLLACSMGAFFSSLQLSTCPQLCWSNSCRLAFLFNFFDAIYLDFSLLSWRFLPLDFQVTSNSYSTSVTYTLWLKVVVRLLKIENYT